ncbi:hypothetical protein BKA66DRAFT_385818, partial [Pyrenochaeta sp. MPI-SDFR-AT-0127]
LVDVALRASCEVNNILDAYKATEHDVEALWYVLRDVEANVRNLLRYIAEFKKSKYAVENFEILSETVTGFLTGFVDVILALRRLFLSKPAEKVK